MNILVTGVNGQLGKELHKLLHNNEQFNTLFTDVDTLDITDNDAVKKIVVDNNINIIINCAAYTSVDSAEDNYDICNKINNTAVENLANAAKEANAKLIHISTDYVFNGMACSPYKESDMVAPCSVYGLTKLAGEKVITEIIPHNHIIIRTSWLYSIHGKNFVKTMLNYGKIKENLNVVYDQIGTPTYAGDLADVIYTIITCGKWIPGIYHFSNEGVCSWFDFTKMIFKLAGITSCNVIPINTEEYPVKAKRPAYSVLDKRKIKQTFGISVPYWTDSLEKCINELITQN